MGGKGSGQYQKNVDRESKTVGVRGTGVPEMPDGLSKEVESAWNKLIGLTSGVTFSQDAVAILEAARLMARQDAINEALSANLADIELNRLSLAISRQLLTVLGKLGLTPRDRQMLLIPAKLDEGAKSRLQKLRERQAGRSSE